MTSTLKLSRLVKQGFWMVGTLAALAACAGDPLGTPVDSNSPVRTISVSPRTASVAVNGTLQLSAVLQDSVGTTLGGRTVTWTSDAARVATVSTSGWVQAVDTGRATITAMSEGKSASATVTVAVGGSTNPSSSHVGYYTAPAGSSSGDGSMSRPWSLSTALAGGNGKVQPGDTIWLRGGTYRGSFLSTVRGAAGKPVVFRQYPGEHAVVDGAGTPRTGNALKVSGEWVTFWGFEMTDTDADRTSPDLGNAGRAHAFANYASHTRYIGLIVHDFGVGLYNDYHYSDVEIVGCVFYNNGWQGPDRGHGHAIYVRSNTGPVTARDNVIFNQFGYGVHVFTNPGEGLLNNIRIEGNVSFNNGMLSNNSSASNILVGGDDRADNDVVKSNMTYFAPTSTSTNMKIGYGSTKNGSVEIRDNYVAGGGPVLNMGYWSSTTASGNTFIGTSSLVTINNPALSASTFSGQTSSTLPTTTKVFVRKVPYETGRVNVVVYNWGKDGAVSVNLDGMLPLGSHYEVHNVQDMNGSPVTSGTFNGGSVTVPIQAVQAPMPVGWSKHPGTGTEFSTFIVTIRQ